MRLIRRASIASTLAIAAALLPLGVSNAAGTGAVHPGIQTYTAGGQCTANFIFSDGTNKYLGQAAHCAGTGGNTETNGCTAGTLGLGQVVTDVNDNRLGVVAYSSWVTMQTAPRETDANTCAYNDLTLILLDAGPAANTDPTIPFWGGPGGINTTGCAGQKVYSYGNSSLRGGATQLSPKTGVCSSDDGGGWSHNVATASPGIPGDSGSAFLDQNGNALGVLSTLEAAPLAGSNNIGDINKELNYMHAHSSITANLVLGTTPFNGGKVPIGVGIAGL